MALARFDPLAKTVNAELRGLILGVFHDCNAVARSPEEIRWGAPEYTAWGQAAPKGAKSPVAVRPRVGHLLSSCMLWMARAHATPLFTGGEFVAQMSRQDESLLLRLVGAVVTALRRRVCRGALANDIVPRAALEKGLRGVAPALTDETTTIALDFIKCVALVAGLQLRDHQGAGRPVLDEGRFIGVLRELGDRAGAPGDMVGAALRELMMRDRAVIVEKTKRAALSTTPCASIEELVGRCGAKCLDRPVQMPAIAAPAPPVVPFLP